MSKDKIKAYQVNEVECSVIVFEKSNVAARRVGAGELNTEFEYIESCRRAPEFDKYASLGSVPLKVLVQDHGWMTECNKCYSWVGADHDEGPLSWTEEDTAICHGCSSKA